MFRVVRRLTEEGVGIVYISHRLDEVARIGDTITVLKDGRTVATDLSPTTPTAELVAHMIGRDLGDVFPAAGSSVARRRRCCGCAGSPDGRSSTTSTSTCTPARSSASAASSAPAAPSCSVSSTASTYPRPARWRSTGEVLPPGRPDLAVRAGVGFTPEERKSQGLWAAGRSPATCPWPPSGASGAGFSSTGRRSGTAPAPPPVARRPRPMTPTGSWPSCPAGTSRRSCWPDGCSATARCCCSTSRPGASTSAPRPRSTG